MTNEKPGSNVRVLNLSSEAHYFAPGIIYDQDQLQSNYEFRRHGQSKLANILYALELQRRYPSITATALHPGVILTNLYAPQIESNPLIKFVLQLINVFLRDVPNGAKNSLWAATGPRDEV
jgi:NAD(P)-dependent dehydrogenase (short-subunit alcohol dehydrogenase family)